MADDLKETVKAAEAVQASVTTGTTMVGPLAPVADGSLITTITNIYPRLLKGAANAIAETTKIKEVTEENLEDVKDLIIPVRTTGDKMTELRMSVTRVLDQIKDQMMVPEKQVKDEMERLRAGVGKVEQEKIRRNKQIEDDARKKKLHDQAIIDMVAKIKLNLTDIVIAECRVFDAMSQKYFNDIKTLEDFEKMASTYVGAKWRLKKEHYDNCFNVSYNTEFVTKDEAKVQVDKLRDEMSYEMMNAVYIEKATPIINTWKTKIPQLKEELKARLNASESERTRLENESKARQAAETQRNEEYLKEQQGSMQATVQTEQTLNKVEAEFTEQGIQQGMEKTGPKKKVIKFKTEKPVAEFCEIIFHCAKHPKFKGFIKRDKDGKPILDDQGRVQYIDAVQFFLDFFAANCDAAIKNTEVFEDAKVIIRK